ncbi:MAG: hypothetical protein HOO67_06070 [Candidatus Peribacteraceae bacterium]|nr:hypothetical protein [Candidatus Peribacteraceae bacterium]
MSTPRLEDFDLSFLSGMDSLSEPGQLEAGFYSRSMNTVNRGGTVQCRPGHRCKMVLPQGNLQGGIVFRPKKGPEVLLVAVDGIVYSSVFPFSSFEALSDIEFAPHVRQLFFVQAEQSIVQNADGSLTLVAPKNIVVIQDGGLTPAAVYDGTRAVHQRGEGTIPAGGPMAWSGDRLWVARDANLFASDIANPVSFTEPLYIATISAFVLPGVITALAEIPSAETASLLVFTDEATTLIQSGIRNRAAWPTVENFQRVILPKVGCVSERSITSHLGLLYWYSAFGLTSLDSALLTKQTSVLPYSDNEMADSKARLSADLAGVALGYFENYLMVSVPFEDRYNRHTWVLDQAPLQRATGRTQPAWNSFWTGTRPVQWLFGTFHGENRIFHLSHDFDGNNRLWESFSPDRLDDGCPITWYLETRAVDGNVPLRGKKFRYADIFLQELSGNVDIGVFWAGGFRGKFKRILSKSIRATRGSIRSGETITAETLLFALKKQQRTIRTQDAMQLAMCETQQSTGVESDDAEFLDESFQLLIVGSGPGAVQGIRYYMEPPPGIQGSNGPNKETSAAVEEDETEENFVRFDGAAAESHEFSDALLALSDDIPVYTANTSVTFVQDGFTAVGTGSGESVISQADADKIAACVATKKAVAELQRVLPRIVSLGLSANS